MLGLFKHAVQVKNVHTYVLSFQFLRAFGPQCSLGMGGDGVATVATKVGFGHCVIMWAGLCFVWAGCLVVLTGCLVVLTGYVVVWTGYVVVCGTGCVDVLTGCVVVLLTGRVVVWLGCVVV